MKTLFFIPNLVTTANIFCGFLSLLLTLQGHYSLAAWYIIAAGVFDLFDGRLARLLRATSAFGESYDTLSDITSFGIAPALLLQRMLVPMGERVAFGIAFTYLIAVTFRLARFSVQIHHSHDAKKSNFSGLSSPPSAATLSAFVLFVQSGALPAGIPVTPAFAVLGLFLAALMVSRISFPSFKSVNWRSPQGILILAAAVTGTALIAVRPRVFTFVVGISFVLVSLSCSLARKWMTRAKS